MKLSIVVAAQPANFSGRAGKLNLEDSLAQVKILGYNGFELAVRDPNTLSLHELSYLIKKFDLPLCAIATGLAFTEDGLSFTHPDSKVRRLAIERIKSHVRLASHFAAVVIIGLVRGNNVSKVGLERAESWLIEALTECSNEDKDVMMVIEMINRYETDLLNTVHDGLRFLDRLKIDRVGLHLDTFHMNIEEPSMTNSIMAAKDRLFHFHIADSNRWYPGAGHIDFGQLIDALDKIGYGGFLSAEILPMPDPETAAKNTIENMRKIIKSKK